MLVKCSFPLTSRGKTVKDEDKPGLTAGHGIALTTLLVGAMGAATAAEFDTISKGSKAGDQVADHKAGQFVVKCVGAALGGENDCGALDGSHQCAGLSPANIDFSDNEWVYLTLEECANHPSGKFLMKDADGNPTVMAKSEFQFKKVVE